MVPELREVQEETPTQQQARISASSATRELDELMASLSDFKVQSNVSLEARETNYIYCYFLSLNVPYKQSSYDPLLCHTVEYKSYKKKVLFLNMLLIRKILFIGK